MWTDIDHFLLKQNVLVVIIETWFMTHPVSLIPLTAVYTFKFKNLVFKVWEKSDFFSACKRSNKH